MTWKRGLLIFAAGALLLLLGVAVFVAREAERISVTTPPSAGPLVVPAARAEPFLTLP